MKKVLVVSYSQTGQLNEVLTSLTAPFKKQSEIEIYHKTIQPQKAYPFPWNFFEFMDCFPESVYLDPCEIEPLEDTHEYDLVILAYQVWFLSPSIPITAFLKSQYAKEKLKNKPVITLIGCRNMWIMAQENVKMMLNNIQAKLIDNIVLVDQGSALATFITTPRWMLTGKKDALWNVFPKAGIHQDEITAASRFGRAIVQALENNWEKENRSLCHGLNAVNVNEKLIKSEKIGKKSFLIWGKLIRQMGAAGNKKRYPAIALYTVFLIVIILTVVPINMMVQTIIRKINKQKIEKEKYDYELPSGNGNERMKEFKS